MMVNSNRGGLGRGGLHEDEGSTVNTCFYSRLVLEIKVTGTLEISGSHCQFLTFMGGVTPVPLVWGSNKTPVYIFHHQQGLATLARNTMHICGQIRQRILHDLIPLGSPLRCWGELSAEFQADGPQNGAHSPEVESHCTKIIL